MSKPTLDVIDKWPGFTKIFSQKNFKIWLNNRVSTFMIIYILSLLIANSSTKKNYKKDMARFVGL